MRSDKLPHYLRTYRKRAGLSQDELAWLLGCQSARAGLELSQMASHVPYAPELVLEGGTPRLVLAGDPLHPTDAGPSRRRFVLEGRRWRLEFDAP